MGCRNAGRKLASPVSMPLVVSSMASEVDILWYVSALYVPPFSLTPLSLKDPAEASVRLNLAPSPSLIVGGRNIRWAHGAIDRYPAVTAAGCFY